MIRTSGPPCAQPAHEHASWTFHGPGSQGLQLYKTSAPAMLWQNGVSLIKMPIKCWQRHQLLKLMHASKLSNITTFHRVDSVDLGQICLS